MDEYISFALHITVGVLLVCFSFFVGMTVNGIELKALGQMVCDENDMGEFKSFDSEDKIIECAPKPEYKEYDGGYIKMVDDK